MRRPRARAAARSSTTTTPSSTRRIDPGERLRRGDQVDGPPADGRRAGHCGSGPLGPAHEHAGAARVRGAQPAQRVDRGRRRLDGDGVGELAERRGERGARGRVPRRPDAATAPRTPGRAGAAAVEQRAGAVPAGQAEREGVDPWPASAPDPAPPRGRARRARPTRRGRSRAPRPTRRSAAPLERASSRASRRRRRRRPPAPRGRGELRLGRRRCAPGPRRARRRAARSPPRGRGAAAQRRRPARPGGRGPPGGRRARVPRRGARAPPRRACAPRAVRSSAEPRRAACAPRRRPPTSSRSCSGALGRLGLQLVGVAAGGGRRRRCRRGAGRAPRRADGAAQPLGQRREPVPGVLRRGQPRRVRRERLLQPLLLDARPPRAAPRPRRGGHGRRARRPPRARSRRAG